MFFKIFSYVPMRKKKMKTKQSTNFKVSKLETKPFLDRISW